MSPSEVEEVDFTQSQEPIPQVICQGREAITINRSSGSFHSLQITAGPGHTLFYSQAIDSSSLLNIPRVQYVWYQWKSLHGIRDTFEM